MANDNELFVAKKPHSIADERDVILSKTMGTLTKGPYDRYENEPTGHDEAGAGGDRGTRALMGDDYWPYGVKANLKELELVMRYTHEQGLAKRRLKVDEVFHPSTLE